MTLVANATAAFVAALQASPAVAPRVDRVRLRELPEGTTTAVSVRPRGGTVAGSSLRGPLSWQYLIDVECTAKTTASNPPDVAVDALMAAVYARLMADRTLAGAVANIEPDSFQYDFDVDGMQTTCVTLVFKVTQFSTPTAL